MRVFPSRCRVRRSSRRRCWPRPTIWIRRDRPGHRLRPHRQRFLARARGCHRRAGRRCLRRLLQRDGRDHRAADDRCRPGDTVVLPSDGYYLTRAFARDRLQPMGVRVIEVPTAGPYPSFDGVRLVLLETPANPGLDVADIAAPRRRRTRRRSPRRRQHRRHTARADAAGARRGLRGRVRHQSADRALRPASRLCLRGLGRGSPT